MQKVQRVLVGGCAAIINKTVQPALTGGGKHANRACGAMEMHPYSRFAGLLLKGSMSLDSQSSTTPYESSSFATPEGEVLAALRLEMLMR